MRASRKSYVGAVVVLICAVVLGVAMMRDQVTARDSEAAATARRTFSFPCLTNTTLLTAGTVRYGGLLRGRRTQHFWVESGEKHLLTNLVDSLEGRRNCGAFHGIVNGNAEAAPGIPWWFAPTNFIGYVGSCEIRHGRETVLVRTFAVEQLTNALFYTRVTLFK